MDHPVQMPNDVVSPAGKRLTALMSSPISSEDQFPPPLPPPLSPPPPPDAPFDDCSTMRRFSSSCREFSLDTAAKNADFFASPPCGEKEKSFSYKTQRENKLFPTRSRLSSDVDEEANLFLLQRGVQLDELLGAEYLAQSVHVGHMTNLCSGVS